MDIFLDGKAVETGNWSGCTIGELVQHLCRLPEFKDRVVEAISVDGLELHDWEGNSAVVLPQAARVDIKTQSVAELIAYSAQSAKEYLPRLNAGGTLVATLLQEGREQEAFGLVSQLVEGLQWYSEFLASVAKLMPLEQRRASELLLALTNLLEQLLQSWEEQDHTLLADLLEYELSSELQMGLEFVEVLSQYSLAELGNRE